MKLDISGGKQLTELADRLRVTADRKLGQRLERGMRKGADEMVREVGQRSSSDPFVPRGFEAEFNAALEAKTELRVAHHRTIRITFSAKGRKGHLRKLGDMDEGVLRHPVFGRSRRTRRGVQKNPWVAQRIKDGVITEPAQRAVPLVTRRLKEAVAKVAKDITG